MVTLFMRLSRLFALALALALVPAAGVLLSGCAVGNIGTLAAKVELHSSTATLDLYSVGLHWRTRPDDLGGHLGYSRRTYVFAVDTTLAAGWHLIRVPLPQTEAVAQDLLTIGIEFSAVAPLAGLTLGYSHGGLMARVPADASIYIAYAGSNRRVVALRICKEEEPCELSLPWR